MIDGILRTSAARHGDRPALVAGVRTLSYHQLHAAATNLAADLRRDGVAPGDRVGIHAPNGWEWVVAYHAIAALGAVVVPVNALLTPDEVDFILGDCGAVAVFGNADSLGRLDRAGAASAAARRPFDGFDDLLDRPATPFVPAAIDADAPVTIGYTSGTTGRPKGAVQTHRSVFANIALTATVHVRTERDIVVTALPAPHVYGNVAINSLLLVGGTVVLLERFDAAEALAAIERHRATMFEGVPAMYSMIEATSEWSGADLSSLRVATVGGQTIATSVIDEWERASGAPLLELWGMTEISGLGSTHPAYATNVPGSIGVSLPGVGLRIGRFEDPTVEADHDEPGELQVRGPIVMREYFGRPEATAEAFTADGWLLTGDVATADRHGYIRIVDRRKDMILSGGYNVYPAEVERVVAGVPGVALVAVGRVNDVRLGEVPKAYVVAKPGATLTADTVIEACRERLARYKVPREVVFVDDLPKTSTGKLLRRELGKLDA